MKNNYFREVNSLSYTDEHLGCRTWIGMCSIELLRDTYIDMEFNAVMKWAIDLDDQGRTIDLPFDIRSYVEINRKGDLYFRIVVRVFDNIVDYDKFWRGFAMGEKRVRLSLARWIKSER